MNILIVDDDRDLAESLAEMLAIDGHTATLAFTGEDGVERYRGGAFDLVLMDVKLPGISGVEAFDRIRQVDRDVPVIMMTAYRLESLLSEAVDKGAVAVLHKPFQIETVLSALHRAAPEGIVLLVEDDPDLSAELSKGLSDNGYRVATAATGEQALVHAEGNHIDTMILDLRLPIMSGLEVYLEMKRLDRSVPTIIITGHAEECADEITILRSMAVTGVLFKPFRLIDLLGMIREVQPAGIYGNLKEARA